MSCFGCCFFFCLFYNHHQKKKWQWKWKKNCWSLPSSTFLLCLYTKNCFTQTNFCSSVYHQIFPVVKIFSFCHCCKKWETKGWYCVKATFDISFQRSAKKETSALSHQHKSWNQQNNDQQLFDGKSSRLFDSSVRVTTVHPLVSKLKEEVIYFTKWCSQVYLRAPTSNPSTAINLRNMNTSKVSGRCKILWRIRW